ncbi:hypothetical protein [Candidatus Mycoplasma mahonii]|nr:hypothetical protein [Candidatus Mycoplasma mahonii]WKX02260.1 hypothetical protein O3I44_02550 [Candidatus Mycoplasma mahonii]
MIDKEFEKMKALAAKRTAKTITKKERKDLETYEKEHLGRKDFSYESEIN